MSRLPLYLILPLITILLFGPFLTHAQFGTVTPFVGTSTGTLLGAIRSIVNALLSLVALIAAVVIVFSAVTALDGRDEEEVAQRARNTIIFALLGLVIVALSAVVVNFIILAIP